MILTLGLSVLAKAQAQVEAAPTPGFKGPIEREQLIEQLRVRKAEGYIISGDDLRAAIETIEKPIRLSHCVIKGGLQLPAVVSARLEVADCTIEQAPLTRAHWAGTAVYAREVRFDADVAFSDTHFGGPVVFDGAQFTKKAVFFPGCEFSRGLSFTRARFSGQAFFIGARLADANFTEVRFEEDASFSRALFGEGTDFTGAEFQGKTRFRRATFEGAGQLVARFRGPVNFREAQFKGEAHFSVSGARAEFEGTGDFKGTVFGGSTNFEDVVFKGTASFEGASFQGAIFTGVAFEGDALFTRATFITAPQFQTHFRSRAGFREARFQGDAHFSPTQDDPDLPTAQFDDQADFSAATFAARSEFQGARFKGAAVFKGADFHGRAVFRNTDFEEATYFNVARFRGRTEFYDSRIAGVLTFTETEFESPVSFLRVQFGNTAEFVQARFAERAYFGKAVFSEDAVFRAARFEADAVFRDAVFQRLAVFQGVGVSGTLDLRNTTYSAYADLREVRIGGLNLNSSERPSIVAARFDMRGARIGEAHLEDVIFEQEVDVSDAAFGVTTTGKARGTTVLRFVTFESPISFARAHFEGPVVLENVKFQDVADFTDTRFLPVDGQGASFALSYVDFSELRIHWSQLPPTSAWVQGGADGIEPPFGALPVPRTPEPRSRGLESLETSFRDQGQLADANQAYYRRKRTELMEVRREGLTWRRLWLEAQWLFWGVTSGYGTRLGWIVAWAALVDLFFTLIYWVGATIHREPHPEAELAHSFQLRLLDFPKQYLTEKPTLIVRSMLVDAFRASSVILFKMGYRDTTLSGTVGRVKVSYLVRVEWALGYFVLAALTVTLTNTQPLLNRLISGLF